MWLIACGDKQEKTLQYDNQRAEEIPPIPFTTYKSSDDKEIGNVYMPTGFYSLTENEGVKMLKERSDEVYNLNRFPFVSVDDIIKVSLDKEPTDHDTITSITMVLNIAGTKALAEGTGNPKYPYMAVVITNKLLYIVKNVSNIKTGVMSILLTGYSEDEIKGMVEAIKQKK